MGIELGIKLFILLVAVPLAAYLGRDFRRGKRRQENSGRDERETPP